MPSVMDLEQPFGDETVDAFDAIATDTPVDEGESTGDPAQQPEPKPEETQDAAEPNAEQTPEPEKTDVKTDWRAETFKTRTELQDARAEVETLKAQIAEKEDEFVGIRVDGSINSWTGRAQFDSLPQTFQDDLIEHIIFGHVEPDNPQSPSNLEIATDYVLKAPEDWPDHYNTLLAATGEIMQQRLGRPFQEIAQILTTVQHYKPDEVAALLQDRSLPRDTDSGRPATGDVAPRGGATLFQYAQQAGIDTEDPQQLAFLRQLDNTYRGFADQVKQLEARLGGFESSANKEREARVEMYTADMHGLVDQQAEQQIQEAIQAAVKDSLPNQEDRDTLVPYLEAVVERELSRNSKAQGLLDTARELAVDYGNGKLTLHPKVAGHLRAYRVYALNAAKNAAATLLKRTVVPAAAQTRATDASKTRGAQLIGTASTTVAERQHPDLAASGQEKLTSLDDVVGYVERRQAARDQMR